MSETALVPPKDTNGTLALLFGLSIVLIGPVGAVLAIVFAVRSRRELEAGEHWSG